MKFSTKNITRIFLLLLTTFLFLYCQNEFKSSNSSERGTYQNLADSVKYVGMQVCQSCHQNIHESFTHTGMGESFHHATLEKTAATFGDHALVHDEKNDFYYFPYFKDSVMFVDEFRIENGDTIHKRTEKISYIVGSGQHTNSHILDFNGYIFQAPITYYTQTSEWDLAPGYEQKNDRFGRLLNSECLTCHNHFPKLEIGSMHKFSEIPTGIECERCHGPGEIHVREKLAGNLVDTSKFVDYSIVNPKDLPRDLQMDLCQRCHLQGVAVLNEGKTFYDFRPGMKLSDVMNVFLPRYENSDKRFIMASQADRLRQSKCYLNSEMTCITCHNPHISVEKTGKSHYNDACQNCHQTQICTAPPEEIAAESNDCSGCHLPRSGSIDIPHVNITDHYISKSNIKSKEIKPTTGNGDFLGLQILTKDFGTPLEMARGYLALYDKFVENPMMLDSARYYLSKAKIPFEEQFETLIHYSFNRNDYQNIIQISKQVPIENVKDGWTAYRIGQAYFGVSDYQNALKYFKKATKMMRLNLDFQEKLGTTYLALQEIPDAIRIFNFVLKENEKRPIALNNLGYAKVLIDQISEGEKYYDKALALNPDYENALMNKVAVLVYRKEVAEAKKLLRRVLEINPNNEKAKMALEQF